MMIVEFYTRDLEHRMKKRIRFLWGVVACMALFSLSVCLYLLLNAKTLTAEKNELTVYLVNGAAGSGIIGVILFLLNPLRKELAHFRTISDTERREVPFQNGFRISEQNERIPGGVSVRRVIPNDGGGQRFFVNERFAPLLWPDAAGGSFYEANGYIVAIQYENGGGIS